MNISFFKEFITLSNLFYFSSYFNSSHVLSNFSSSLFTNVWMQKNSLYKSLYKFSHKTIFKWIPFTRVKPICE
jgi:hypothetical protein